MFIMTFLTNLWVTEKICSLRLVLEGKTGKEISDLSIELFEKLSANNFALFGAEGNTSRPLNTGAIADFPLLRLLLAIHEKSLHVHIHVWQLPFATLLQQLLAYLNFNLDSEHLSFWYKWKVIPTNNGSCTSSWKPSRRVRFNLILSMRDIYINSSNLIPLAKFPSSSRSTEFKDILPKSISQMITKTIPISTRIVTCYAIKQGILLWIWWKVNGKKESHCRTNTSIRRKK